MLELPEAINLAKQISHTLKSKQIAEVVPLQSPHKFAWFQGDPMDYPKFLIGKTVTSAESHGGMVEIIVEDVSLILSDGVNIRYIETETGLPKKHQLLIRFADNSFLCFSLQMYGGIICAPRGGYDNEYYLQATTKPSPLEDEFDKSYFQKLLEENALEKLSAKAFLATEQRIPGLGNGVLQDILFNAQIHPKIKMHNLSDQQKKGMFQSIKATLADMTEKGGRDTEKDLFSRPCGYKTILSKITVNTACPNCGAFIEKASYMGGSIYFCPKCQKE